MRGAMRKIAGLLARFKGDGSAVAAVEFALVLPVLVVVAAAALLTAMEAAPVMVERTVVVVSSVAGELEATMALPMGVPAALEQAPAAALQVAAVVALAGLSSTTWERSY